MNTTVQIPTKEGATLEVQCFGEFDYEIGGQTFRFLVTQEIDGVTKCVTHKASGKRACSLSVSEEYVRDYTRLADDITRAKFVLDKLCARIGGARIRSVLSANE